MRRATCITKTVIIRLANTRCSAWVNAKPPSRRAMRRAHGASLNSSGMPVDASPRKLNIRNACNVRSTRPNLSTWRTVAAVSGCTSSTFSTSSMRLLHGGSGAILQRAQQPQQRVQPEEPERDEQQPLHAFRRVEQQRVAIAIVLVGMRVVFHEIRARILVALAAGLDEIPPRDRR